jgi:transposase
MDAEIISLKRTVRSQEMEIAKLSKNSTNSNKPPSSDDVTKPKGGKGKGKNGKKRKVGGQPGHPRHERPLFEEEAINVFHSHT